MEKGVPIDLVRLFAQLAQPAERSGAVRELATLLQAEAILFFVRDPEIGTFLIAPGFNRTLPDGQVWQKFVSECSGLRCVERRLPFPKKGSWTMATGLGWNKQAALIVMGSSPQRLEEVAELLPVLAITVQTEHALALQAAQAGLAHEVAQKSNALAKGLDNSRRAAQQEITARKQAEKALNIVGEELKSANAELIQARDNAIAAASAKDDFLAALSHELRTPLNPVLLIASEAAGNSALPDEVRADFEMITKNVGLEARLIDDLLDLTRISRGKILIEKQQVALGEVLNDTVRMLRADLAEKNITLCWDSPGPAMVAWGDPVRLHQIFWNVIKNAVKFTPAGGNIWITNSTSMERRTLVIQVRDSGIGFTAEEEKRIFEAFSQGDHAAGSGPHRFGGLGLGLAITRALTELHGGNISATSAGRGCGSTFVVELPFQPPAASSNLGETRGNSATPAPTSDDSHPSPLVGPRLSILLVEDHAASRKTLEKLLLRRGHRVHPVGSSEEAQTVVQRTRFDLVISDIGLPDRDGYQLMSELRLAHPGLVGIALTGYGMGDDLAKGQAAGFALHLVKPVNLRELEKAITTLFPADAESI